MAKELLSHLEPSATVASEVAFSAQLRRAVDDLFTHETIHQKMALLADVPELAPLVEAWKQGLALHLQDTAQGVVRSILSTVDTLQAGDPATVTAAEQQEWAELEAHYKPFTVSSICRADLSSFLSEAEIARLDDSDMEKIADKMSDAYRDSGGYWESLEVMAKAVLAQDNQAEAEIGEPIEVNSDELEMPDLETLQQWEAEGGCEAACPHSCWVEPDGHCEHGKPSWLLQLGLI